MAVEIDSAGFESARRKMVDGQVRPSDVTRADIIDAFLWAPRERFLPKSKRPIAYASDLIEIAPGRFELEARVLAKMIMESAPRQDDLALVIGSGGGYAAAVLSRLCAAVVTLEQDEALQTAASEALKETGVDTVIAEAGPHHQGCAQHAPYNLILVNGAVPAAERGVADPLERIVSEQLGEGGRLATMRSAGAAGWCEIITRSAGHWSGRRVFEGTGPLLPGFERKAGFEF